MGDGFVGFQGGAQHPGGGTDRQCFGIFAKPLVSATAGPASSAPGSDNRRTRNDAEWLANVIGPAQLAKGLFSIVLI
jgi:hypothetical protein